MYSDGNSFFKRATIFLTELRKKTYPSASRLAELAQCSKNTAQRTVERLIKEYALPVEYDRSRHGYFLRDHSFQLPLLPPEKNELTALLLLREMARIIDAKDLHEKIDALWYQYASLHSSVVKELESLASHFSSDLTAVGSLTNLNFLDLLHASFRKTPCEIRYQSWWRHEEEQSYRAVISHLRFLDGNLYLLCENEERTFVLNASSIKKIHFLEDEQTPNATKKPAAWNRDEFGIWIGEDAEEIEIHILPPASHYFASQRWAKEQEDHFEGETLVRRLRCSVSPEIVRRVLSLGSCVSELKPKALKDMVSTQAKAIAENLSA